MDNFTAFANGEANRDKPLKAFDWVKAANIIVERKAKHAYAGLAGDFEYTGGDIFRDGKPDLESYTYLASTWATPKLVIDDEEIDCWRYASETGYGSSTKWPPEALKILVDAGMIPG